MVVGVAVGVVAAVGVGMVAAWPRLALGGRVIGNGLSVGQGSGFRATNRTLENTCVRLFDLSVVLQLFFLLC